jgi:hypothetical protein
MDSSFLRKFEKREQDKATEKVNSTKTPEQLAKEDADKQEREARPTIPQMVQDPVMSRELGAFLKAHNDPAIQEMGARMLSGKLVSGDVGGLELKRDELFDQKALSEKLSEKLQGQRFEDMLQHSAKLQSLCQAYGKEQIQEILQSGAKNLPFLDQKGFKELAAVFDEVEKFERDVEGPLQAQMTTFCKKFGLTEDAVIKAADEKSPVLRRHQLEQAIRDNMSGWAMTLPKWLPAQWAGQLVGWGDKKKDRLLTPQERYSKYGAEAMKFSLNNPKSKWQNAVEMRSKVLDTSGSFIASFVSENKEVREALGRVINGELPYMKDVIDNTTGYDEAREMLLNESNAKKYVERYKSANKNVDFSKLSTTELDTHMDKFYDEAQKEAQAESAKKSGFWATVIGVLFGSAQERADFTKDPAMRSMLAGA